QVPAGFAAPVAGHARHEHRDGLLELGCRFRDPRARRGQDEHIRAQQVEEIIAEAAHAAQLVAGRVIAATNRPIEELRREGRFRDDFFYRLCSDVIVLPTLRQRISESAAELEQLVKVLVARVAGEGYPELVGKVLEALKDLP